MRLFADDPIDDPAGDLLERSAFAHAVVDILGQTAAETPSAVLGLIGPWGSGKTSLLDLVRQRLSRDQSWSVVDFNPWQAPELDGILREFFAALATALPDDTKDHRYRAVLAKYASAASSWSGMLNLPLVKTDKALEELASFIAPDQALSAIHKQIAERLQDLARSILVVIDDVDRLLPDELLLLFKLVRLLGRPPNVYYLLAFDEETLIDLLQETALARKPSDRALAYLEKVIQIRIDIPPLHAQSMSALLDKAMNYVFNSHELTAGEEEGYRWASAYQNFMNRNLTEPRSIRRFVAQIEAYLPLVKGEADPIDFSIMTFFRTFYPELYSRLGRWKSDLTTIPVRDRIDRPPPHQDTLAFWCHRLTDAGIEEEQLDGVLRVLKELFVPIKAAYDNVTYSGEVVDVLGGSMRVGDPGYFDRYFHFGVPPGDLSDVTVGQAIQEVASEAQGVATAEIPRMLLENPRLVISTDPGSSGTKIRLGSQVGLLRRRGVPQGPEGACRQLVLGEGVPSPCKYDNSAQWFKKQFSGRTVPFTYYLLQNGHSSLCLNVEGGSTANGASIIQWPCDNSKNNEQIRFWIY